MSTIVATVLDTTGIQGYIFGSNRLRENIGASYLVQQATSDQGWVRKALNSLGGEVHVPDPETDAPDAGPHIEDGNLTAELVYAGGGNTVLLFKDMETARAFTRALTARALRDAPGLAIVAAHKPFDWQDQQQQPLFRVIDDLMRHGIDRAKRERLPSAPLMGLGVTAACASTGLAATGTSSSYGAPDDYLVSSEVAAKLQAVDCANKALGTMFQDAFDERFTFPYDLDNLGRTEGTSSYVAIVHADGNGMGKRFEEHGRDHSNRDYITAMRALSWSVNDAGLAALRAIYRRIIASIKDDMVMGEFALSKDDKTYKSYLPFRPLVYGGDDVTFVCDGRLGLTLAALYLQVFQQQKAADDKDLTTCAGVCIVKSHYPFAQAYAMSESLCRGAKRFMRKECERSGQSQAFSALDWHITASGLTGSLAEIRQREYRVDAEQQGMRLAMRPVALERQQGTWHTWPAFEQVVRTLQTGNDWRGRRNKVMGLRDALRAGPEATKQFLRSYGLGQLPEISADIQPGDKELLRKQGWLGKDCGYFDAIEALDFYLPLTAGEERA